jgi:hypothetical protein
MTMAGGDFGNPAPIVPLPITATVRIFSILFPRKVRRALRQEGADALAVVVAAPARR